jgi:hypothetical protein
MDTYLEKKPHGKSWTAHVQAISCHKLFTGNPCSGQRRPRPAGQGNSHLWRSGLVFRNLVVFVCITVVAVLACDKYLNWFISAQGLRTLDLAPRSRTSQASGRGKKVRVSKNGSSCERGQYSQSIMGMGMRWTTLHQHWQSRSSSSM